MSTVTNSYLTFSAIGNREDLADVIYNVSPVECPFQDSVDTVKSIAVKHEWQTDVLAAAATNAVLEGDDTTSSYTFIAVTPTNRINNICQISRKDVIVSATQDAVAKAGREREIVYQLVKRSKELRRDMELTLVQNGNNVSTTGGTTTARLMWPMIQWISSNTSTGTGGANVTKTNGQPAQAARTDGTQRALTESIYKTVLQSIWTNGGNPDLTMSGPFNKTIISTFTGNQTKFQDTSDGELMAAIDVYISDFGPTRVVANRFQRERDLEIIQTDMWAVAYLRPMQTIDLAKTGDNMKGMLLAEYTLESRNELASGAVFDLTTS